MAVPFVKVYYTPSGSDVQQEVTSWISISASRGLDLKAAKCDIVLNNSPWRDKTSGVSIFSEDGQFDIYADYSPITKSQSQLIFSGIIKEINPVLGESGSQFKITCFDKLIILLGGLWSFTYTNQTASQIVSSVTSQLSKGTITTNNVATTTSAGGSFPVIAKYGAVFKPGYEWLTEMSQPLYTGEGRAYIFYVDRTSDLHWFYPAQTSSRTYTEGIDNIYDINPKKNANNIINMVIFNAGTDLSGNGVLWYYFDKTTRTSELHMKYVPMLDLGRDLMQQEIDAGNIVSSSTGTIPYKGLLWTNKTPISSITTTWGATGFSTLADYNTAFRNQLKNVLGTGRAQKIVRQFGKITWGADVTLKGTHDNTAGDLITVVSRTCNFPSQLIRVTDVTHNIDSNGWTTQLELKEDEQFIGS